MEFLWRSGVCFFSLFLTVSAQASIHIPIEPGVEPPMLLSQTGVLTEPLFDYEIIQPLWVDFAHKKRRLFLPAGAKIQFSPIGPYKFPVGTVLVKHFQMEISENIFRNIETRILVRKTGVDPENWVGYTYQWSGEDAKLVDSTASPEVIIDIDSTAAGGARTQKFRIPSRQQCLSCHNESVGFVRSVMTRQLNRDNQLEQMNTREMFHTDIGDSAQYDKFVAISDITASLELKTKTYLDVNCSHCHNPHESAPCNFTGIDFRFDMFNPEALVESGHLRKGVKDNSEIYVRMNSLEPRRRMPFIGSNMKDEVALDVVGKWIESLH